MNLFLLYTKRHWVGFALSITVLSLETLGDLLQPALMARLIDQGVAKGDLNSVLRLGGLMLGVTAFGALSAVVRNLISSRVSQRIGTEIRSDLFRKIQTFQVADLDRFETPSLINRLTQDVGQVQNFLHGLMRIFVKAPLMALGSVALAVALSPRLSTVIISLVPLVTLLILWNLKLGVPLFTKVQQATDQLNGVLREYLAGVRVVKAYGRFDHEESRFAGANGSLTAMNVRAMKTMALFSPATALAVNLGLVAVLWYGGHLVGHGDLAVGRVMAFLQYMTQLLFSLMMVSFVFQTMTRARVSAGRISEVMAVATSDEIPRSPVFSPSNRGSSLALDGVSFAYPTSPGQPILTGITFRVEAGATVGLIGSTGSGKSTLAALLPRLYEPTAGKILLDGLDIATIPLPVLRSRIALVPQKNTLFSGTIAENLRWGREEANEDEIRRAAQLACAHAFITALPEGYETRLGQGGVGLSGGQKQRLAIARALVRHPDLLILDDSVSAVDTRTEAQIRQGLASLAGGVTTLLIAQRIASVIPCDLIVVLEEGRVAGLGRHSDLMKTCEVYRDIFRSQLDRQLPPLESSGVKTHPNV